MISIDPGEDTGWARWDYGALVCCGILHPGDFVRAPEVSGVNVLVPSRVAISVVIEDQHILEQSRQIADPNDILKLAQKASAVGMAFQQFYHLLYGYVVPVRFVKVATWKNSRPKTICHGHMLPNLAAAEKKILDMTLRGIKNQSQRLDVKDAVSLGLWALGRAR